MSDIAEHLGASISERELASRQRRSTTLFLGDTEQFTFDFGGAATATAAPGIPDEEELRQQLLEAKQSELEAVTQRAAVQAAVQQEKRRPLSLEEVQSFATDALERAPAQFLRLPRRQQQGKGGVPSAATLEEAVEMFQEGLRKYDEALWRDHKTAREEKRRERKKRARAA